MNFLQATSDSSNATVYTFASQSLGDAAENRYIIVAIKTRDSGNSAKTINSVTIGGIPATIVVQRQNNAANSSIAGIAIALVPTGTTGDIVITFSEEMLRCGIGVYRAIDINPTPIDIGSSVASNPTYSIDIPAGGFAIGAVANSNSNDSSAVWSGITEKYDSIVESVMLSSGASDEFVSAQTDLALTATISGTNTEPVGVFASWSTSQIKKIISTTRINIKRIESLLPIIGRELINSSLFSDAALKFYARFENGALTTDSSGNGHSMSAISDPALGIGKFGGGIDLDGNDAYSITDHSNLKPTSSFSIAAWFKSSTSSEQKIFQSLSIVTKISGIMLNLEASTYKLRILSGKNTGVSQGTDWQKATGTRILNDGLWHFGVGTWDGSYLDVYVDGLNEAHVAWASAPAYEATNYVRVGCGNNNGTNSEFFTGSLDDVYLLNGKALTATEVLYLYRTGIKKFAGIRNI